MLDRRLRIFQMAAALSNFTQAAAALGMSQPNVTGQIRALERELGTELFVRDGRQLRLTPAGAVLKHEADALLGLADNAVQLVRRAAGGGWCFRLGATMTAGGYVLPGLIAAYWRRHPDTRFQLSIANTEEVEENLRRHRYDLALVEGPFDDGYFFAKPLLEDELVVAGAPELPIWGDGAVSVRRLAADGVRLLLREKGSGTRFYFDAFCRRCGIDVEAEGRIMEIAGFDALKTMLEAGCGVTVISELAIRREVAAGRLRAAPPAEGRIRRRMNFIYLEHDGRKRSEEWMEFCRRQVRRGDSGGER